MAQTRHAASSIRVERDAHSGVQRLALSYGLTFGRRISMSTMVLALVALADKYPGDMEQMIREIEAKDSAKDETC